MLLTVIALSTPAAFADEDLIRAQQKACSDDAISVEEALFHGMARAAVIRYVQPNKLGIGGAEFRVKRNPLGTGCFVYDPRTNFSGSERKLVWWVMPDEKTYAINSPAKLVTPSLKWPRDDGLLSPSTPEIVTYVFENAPISAPTVQPVRAAEFTVRDYKLYRAVISSPASVPEREALQQAANAFGMSADEAKAAIRKVQRDLSRNKWFGSPESEIRHASDWNGETPKRQTP